jgi:hypothetical protein
VLTEPERPRLAVVLVGDDHAPARGWADVTLDAGRHWRTLALTYPRGCQEKDAVLVRDRLVVALDGQRGEPACASAGAIVSSSLARG